MFNSLLDCHHLFRLCWKSSCSQRLRKQLLLPSCVGLRCGVLGVATRVEALVVLTLAVLDSVPLAGAKRFADLPCSLQLVDICRHAHFMTKKLILGGAMWFASELTCHSVDPFFLPIATGFSSLNTCCNSFLSELLVHKFKARLANAKHESKQRF